MGCCDISLLLTFCTIKIENLQKNGRLQVPQWKWKYIDIYVWIDKTYISPPHLCCILMKHILTTIFLERKKTILEIISRLWSNRSTTAPLLSWKRGINSISQQLSICCHSNKAVDENIGSRVQRFKMHTYYLMLCVDVLCFSRRNKILFRKILDLPLKSNYNFHISNSSLW